jgi:hypothetical protein
VQLPQQLQRLTLATALLEAVDNEKDVWLHLWNRNLSLEFGVWSLESGVWSLEFGIVI